MHQWRVDSLESRGNRRIICYDLATIDPHGHSPYSSFPTGSHQPDDGQSILFAETWGCCVKRYWFDGPKSGRLETVIASLPGYPDNIDRSSDGHYWLAIVGMRSPAVDLAFPVARLPAPHVAGRVRKTNGSIPISTPAAW